jgi:hypothetical protein
MLARKTLFFLALCLTTSVPLRYGCILAASLEALSSNVGLDAKYSARTERAITCCPDTVPMRVVVIDAAELHWPRDRRSSSVSTGGALNEI